MKKIFTICLLVLLSFKVYSSHLAGAIIRYKVLNDTTRTYKIFLEVTLDCDPTVSTFIDPKVDVYCGNNCAASLLPVPLLLTLDSSRVKSQVCDVNLTTCNGGILPGLRTYYYSIVSSLPVCPSKIYTFAWKQGNRNATLVNINSPANVAFSVYSSHRFNFTPSSDYAVNTAPILLAPPVPFFYAGSKVCYSLSAIDTIDNDSLAYQLVPCAGTNAVGSCADTLLYRQSPLQYSFTQPFGTTIVHTFDPVTGVLSFTPPPTAAGLYNFAIKIKEYRGGKLIGEYIRDLQCAIITGGTNISCDPSIVGQDPIAGIDTVAKYATTCCGSPFQLDFTFAASGGGAFTLDSINSNYPSWAAVSLIVSPTAGLVVRLEGTPPCPGGYLAPITLKIQQKCLPGVVIPSVSIVIFKLFIREDFSAYPQNVANPIEDTIICAGGLAKLRAFGTTNPDYWWTVVKGDSSSLNNGFTFRGSQYTAFPKRTTKYRVIDSTAVKLPGSCQATDFVTVFVIDSFKVQTNSVPEDCRNNRFSESVAIIAPKSFDFNNNKIRMTYDWYASNNVNMPTRDSLEFNNNNVKNPRFSPFTAGSRCVEVIAIPKETKACQQRDTLCQWIRFNDFPSSYNGLKNLIQYCKGDTIKLDVGPIKSNTVKACAIASIALPASGTPANSSLESTNPFRFPSPSVSNRFKKLQFIITKAELLAVNIKGNSRIDRIAFNLSGVGGINNQAVKFLSLKMGITQKNDYALNGNYYGALRELLNIDGKLVTPINNSDLVVLLDKAFLYDESGNLVVELVVEMPSIINNFNAAINISALQKTNIAVVNAGADFTLTSSASSGTQLNERPALKLGFCAAYGPLSYTWVTPQNLGTNNPNTFIPVNAGNNISVVLNPLRNDPTRKDTQFVNLIMRDDSSSCFDTSRIAFPKIQSKTYVLDPNNPDSKFMTDSICTNTEISLKVDSLYSVTAEKRYKVRWYYRDLNKDTLIYPKNIFALNTTKFKPQYTGTAPKKAPIYAKVYARDSLNVKTNFELCDADSVMLTVFPDAKLNFTTPDLTKCINKAYTLIANATNYWPVTDTSIANFDSVKYVWRSFPDSIRIDTAVGLNNEKLKVSNEDSLIILLSAKGACIDSTKAKRIKVNVPFIDSLDLDFTKNEFDRCANKPIPLNGLITGKTGSVISADYTHNWLVRLEGSSVTSNVIAGNTEDVVYTFPAPGKYIVTYKAVDSCLYRPESFSDTVEVIPCDIPNVFTPDGDGKNEYFAVNFAIGQSAILTIYDRWGKEVYKNANYTCSYSAAGIDPTNNCFTAKDLNDGTYFYALEIPGDKKYQGYVQVLNKK
jgi:gliding motility-associated-like protein